ncbi:MULTISPECIES: hypothetical protein [Rhodococcus]|uniref:Uncharacterized protein n=1 Tax=Rhodococcus globerulus TaxID=33008 RepID=A0ABU4C359_RHOGO|nr:MULTISPECIES: hypothetical protein [Rhodococcus]MDV6270928.1 hypothetical protein [Rhodococcus globerulus]MDV8064878.1 hypothetical protein [Rhodococcus sp. IEGM 1366]
MIAADLRDELASGSSMSVAIAREFDRAVDNYVYEGLADGAVVSVLSSLVAAVGILEEEVRSLSNILAQTRGESRVTTSGEAATQN